MRRSLLGCLLALLAYSSAACSGASDPAVTPTTAASTPTPSPSASVVPTPTLPASATPDQRGAEVFVRYFWAVVNYTYASGDTTVLTSISTKACKYCANVQAQVGALARDGKRTQGGVVTADVVIAPPGDAKDGLIIYSIISRSASRVVLANGEVDSFLPAEPKRRSDVRAVYAQGRWSMDGVSVGGPPNG